MKNCVGCHRPAGSEYYELRKCKYIGGDTAREANTKLSAICLDCLNKLLTK